MRLKTNITCLADLEYWVEEDEDIFFREAHVEIDEPFEHLPKFESRKEYLTRVHGNMWDLPKFDHSWYWKLPLQKKLRYIINNNIGKSYDLTFSYCCKKLKYYDLREDFTHYFKPYYYYYRGFHNMNDYLVDDDGLIQLNPDRRHRYSNKNWKKIDQQSHYEKQDMIRKSNRLHKYLKSQIDYKAILKERKHENNSFGRYPS